jgi:hypothetical protein
MSRSARSSRALAGRWPCSRAPTTWRRRLPAGLRRPAAPRPAGRRPAGRSALSAWSRRMRAGPVPERRSSSGSRCAEHHVPSSADRRQHDRPTPRGDRRGPRLPAVHRIQPLLHPSDPQLPEQACAQSKSQCRPAMPDGTGSKHNQGRPAEPNDLGRKCVRRRPTLPRSGPRSTIGAERLSFRVRDGTGRFPLAMVAETLWRYGLHHLDEMGTVPREPHSGRVATHRPGRQEVCVVANPRPISTSQLQTLLFFHFWPINPVVYAGALLHKGWESSS